MADNEQLLVPDTEVAARYGRTLMTLHRWTNDPDLGFPHPVVIRRRNYRKLSELDAFDARQAKRTRRAQIRLREAALHAKQGTA